VLTTAITPTCCWYSDAISGAATIACQAFSVNSCCVMRLPPPPLLAAACARVVVKPRPRCCLLSVGGVYGEGAVWQSSA
jgi:hypothetical protein